MFTINSTIEIHLIRKEDVHKDVQEFLETQMRQALHKWLRAILLKIPRYTGASRATFKPIGQKLGVAVGLGKVYAKYPERARFKKSTRINGRKFPLDGSVADAGPFFEQIPNGIKFTFTEELPYVVWNSVFPAPQWIKLPSNPPWFAFDAGEKAFLKYAQEEMPKRKVFKKAFKKVVING